jgi:hypothetical protein
MTNKELRSHLWQIGNRRNFQICSTKKKSRDEKLKRKSVRAPTRHVVWCGELGMALRFCVPWKLRPSPSLRTPHRPQLATPFRTRIRHRESWRLCSFLAHFCCWRRVVAGTWAARTRRAYVSRQLNQRKSVGGGGGTRNGDHFFFKHSTNRYLAI